jgi:cytochrome c oxidase subunit II
LCKDKEYEFSFRAEDIIHSAYFPHFRAQINTVPGMVTRLKFTPSITTKEMRKNLNDDNFNYILMCNKICGASHSNMKLVVEVLDEAEFNEWWKAEMAESTFKK